MAINGFIGTVPYVILTFPREREIFLKEYSNNMYSVPAYYFAKSLSELPFQFIPPFFYSVLVYWTIGANTSTFSRFLIFLTNYVLLFLAGDSMGILLGSLFNDPRLAMAVFPAIYTPYIITGGFLSTKSNSFIFTEDI
jgi:hypothetical protein